MSTRTIRQVLPATSTPEGDGVTVHRTIGTQGMNTLDPFLLLDEFVIENANSGAGFPNHPHRGFETVTYMLSGQIHHADNAGNSGTIGPGDAQWMTAGRGVVHSEMPRGDGRVHGMQLWVNLAATDKMIPPRYQDIVAADIPVSRPAEGVEVRVVAGEHEGTRGPINGIALDPLYLDVSLDPDTLITIATEPEHQAFIYVIKGAMKSVGETLPAHTLAAFTGGDQVAFSGGPDGGRAILVAARELKEPVARYGPFVMNTRDEINQAVEDYRNGKI